MLGLSSRPEAAAAAFVPAEVNGEPALLALLDGVLLAVVVPEIHEGRVSAVRTIVNPDKLAFAAAQLA